MSDTTTGNSNTASGDGALARNSTDSSNTAVGDGALWANGSGSSNTAIGAEANVSASNLTNATPLGAGAIVNDSNKIRLGNANVTRIEGQVGFSASSDRNQKENFQPVDGEAVLGKIRGLKLTPAGISSATSQSSSATTVRWRRIFSPPLATTGLDRSAPRPPSPRPTWTAS